jgi:WD40 repeat protein
MSQIPHRKALHSTLAFGTFLALAAIGPIRMDAQAVPAQRATDRTHIEEVLRGMNRGRGFGQVAISPDGNKVAWIEGGRGGSEIHIASPSDLAKTERVTAATNPDQHCREGEFAWAPDSKSFAFFSDCANSADHQVDLYLSRLDGTPARRLTSLKGLPQAPVFSADGSKIAFLFVEGATRPAGALAAMKPPSGVIGEDGVEVQRVAVARVDAIAQQPALVTPPNLHAYEFDWAPDSKGIAYVAADPPRREQLVGGEVVYPGP